MSNSRTPQPSSAHLLDELIEQARTDPGNLGNFPSWTNHVLDENGKPDWLAIEGLIILVLKPEPSVLTLASGRASPSAEEKVLRAFASLKRHGLVLMEETKMPTGELRWRVTLQREKVREITYEMTHTDRPSRGQALSDIPCFDTGGNTSIGAAKFVGLCCSQDWTCA